MAKCHHGKCSHVMQLHIWCILIIVRKKTPKQSLAPFRLWLVTVLLVNDSSDNCQWYSHNHKQTLTANRKRSTFKQIIILQLPARSVQAFSSFVPTIQRSIAITVSAMLLMYACRCQKDKCAYSSLSSTYANCSASNSFMWIMVLYNVFTWCLQCFDAVGWAAGRASGL